MKETDFIENADETAPDRPIEAVWELTLRALAWKGGPEPRLDRTVCRIRRDRLDRAIDPSDDPMT